MVCRSASVCAVSVLCSSVPKVTATSKPSKVSENGKFVLDRRPNTGTHAQGGMWRGSHGPWLSVNLSVVYRSAFPYENPATIILWHFPVSFLPPLVGEDQGSATYPIFVSMGQKTESRCVPSSASSPRSSFCGMKGTQVGRSLPKGNIFFSASLTHFRQCWSNIVKSTHSATARTRVVETKEASVCEK